MSNPRSTTARRPRTLLTATVAAWLVPVTIVGQLAWLAIVPVATVLVTTVLDTRLRAARLPALALAVTYALPYAIWKTRTDPAPSLSRDIDPGLAGLVIAAALVVIVVLHRRDLVSFGPARNSDHTEVQS